MRDPILHYNRIHKGCGGLVVNMTVKHIDEKRDIHHMWCDYCEKPVINRDEIEFLSDKMWKVRYG
jgi:hypothetical protein